MSNDKSLPSMEDHTPLISTTNLTPTYTTNTPAILAWLSTVLILSLLGNLYHLHSSILHRAVKLDKMSVWIVQNLAVADIANCVFVVVPVTVTVAVDFQWRLGGVMCAAVAQYNVAFLLANGFFINALSINKLVRCLCPLRMMSSTRKQRLRITIVVIVLSLLPTAWTVFGVSQGYFVVSENFLHLNGLCNIGYQVILPYPIIVMNYLVYILFNAGPCVSLITTNIALVVVAIRKSNNTTNKTNILIVILTTVSFLGAVLPRFISYLVPWYGGRLFEELAWYVLFFVSWINPFIYLATNKHFRDFTFGRLKYVQASFRLTLKSLGVTSETEDRGHG